MFAPRDPLFAERVRASFARQTLMATLGASLARVEPGEVDILLPHAPGILQQHGFVHGGAVTSIADSAAGYATLTLAPVGTGILTVEFKINLLAPAKAARLVACGRVVRPGRTLTVAQTEVFGLDPDGSRVQVALLTATMMALEGKAGVVD
nr:PaaI family thioesterase [Enterovirga sp.]